MPENGYGRQTRLNNPIDADRIRWFDGHGVGVIGFDSCDGGSNAAGQVSVAQLDQLGGLIGEHPRSVDYALVGIIHHHPLPLAVPEWIEHRRFFCFIKPFHEHTVAFDQAGGFLDFVKAHQFRAVMHGHKHIPREANLPGNIPLYGAGSATGMIETEDHRQLLSLNILTIDVHKRVTCRFHLEDTPGGGKSYEREYVIRG